MKIFVIEPRGMGGMIHYAYQLCTALSKQGAEVTLVTSRFYELGKLPHNFTVKAIMNLWPLADPLRERAPLAFHEKLWRKIFWSVRRAFRGFMHIREWFRLVRYLCKEIPDITQFGEIEFPFDAYFLQQLKHRGLILAQICHEFELREQHFASWVTRYINRSYEGIYKSFSVIFFHGHSNLERFSELYNDVRADFHVIPHGNELFFLSSKENTVPELDLRQRYGISPEAPVVLFFGSLTPTKGVDDLIQAFAMLYPHHREARLVISGMPSKFINLPGYFNMIKELGIEHAVYLDHRYIPMDEVPSLMKMATIVVFPYHSATQSGALQVAYSFGKPVIATRVGGLPEAVEEGKSGFLVSPHAPAELAEAIHQLIEDPRKVKEMGDYAKMLSETRFAWDPIARVVLDIYQQLLSHQ